MISRPEDAASPSRRSTLVLSRTVPGASLSSSNLVPKPGQDQPRGPQISASVILLVAPQPSATAVAEALRRDLGAHVEVATQGRSALTALRREEFTLIVLEEHLAAAEPEATEALFTAAGTAPVLEINFGISAVQRVVRQVRSAVRRRAGDEAKARLAVSHSLQNELNASLAGLLLESQLALRGAGPEILPTLQHLIDLASDLRAQMRGPLRD